MTAASPGRIYAVIAHNRVLLKRPCLVAYHEHCRPKPGTSSPGQCFAAQSGG
jgi:hypothetical protein